MAATNAISEPNTNVMTVAIVMQFGLYGFFAATPLTNNDQPCIDALLGTPSASTKPLVSVSGCDRQFEIHAKWLI